MDYITRFAPSPTGRLHLGHIYSALFAAQMGRMQLRIEDIDHTRCREEFITAIEQDLGLLGLHFSDPMRQSTRLADYTKAITTLTQAGLTYPCFCTRSELSLSAHHKRPHIYPGTCKTISVKVRRQRMMRGDSYALRLDTERSRERADQLNFTDLCVGVIAVDYASIGDPVIARKEMATSYHLACVLDDAAQGISLVTRGEDLLAACHIQRLLQALLGLPEPTYCHHPLLRDAQQQRLAKRKGSASFAQLMHSGAISPEQLKKDFAAWFAAVSQQISAPSAVVESSPSDL